MKIKLSEEDIKSGDRWIELQLADGGYICAEFNKDNNIDYIEYKNPGDKKAYAYTSGSLQKLMPTKPLPLSWDKGRKNPCCPNCYAPMIVDFKFCPRCGQEIDWRKDI